MPPILFKAVVALTSLLGQTNSCSLQVAKKCRGYSCEDNKFPLLDYDFHLKRCICLSHPCWSQSDCPENTPHPTFHYNQDGDLQCNCTVSPRCDSKYIALELCKGEYCADERFPLLDWDTDK